MLGWTPYEYYCSSPYEFHCACEGYFIKQGMETQVHRFAAFRIHQSLVQKPLTIDKFWPLKGEEKATEKRVWGDTPEEAQEMWDKIKKAHKID